MSALYFKKEPGQNGSWPAISRQSFPGFGSWLSSPEHAVLSSRARRPKHARTPRFSGARINVEVRVQLRVFRFLVFKTSEMLLYVSERTEQAFFLAAPKRNTNRAPRLHVEGGENPRRLQHHRRTCAIVGCAGRVMPRVVMAAEYHDLIPFVGAGNFSDRVIGRRPFRILFVLNADH